MDREGAYHRIVEQEGVTGVQNGGGERAEAGASYKHGPRAKEACVPPPLTKSVVAGKRSPIAKTLTRD